MNKYIEMIGIDDELKQRLTAHYSKNKIKTEALKKQIAMQLTSNAKQGAVSRDAQGKAKKDIAKNGADKLVSTQDIKNAQEAMTAFENLAVSVEKVKTMSTSFEGILNSDGSESEKIQQLNGVLEQYKEEILQTDNYSDQAKVAFQQMVDALSGERPSLEDFNYGLENFRAETIEKFPVFNKSNTVFLFNTSKSLVK